LRYFPVPTISRELNARPAMTSWSFMDFLRNSSKLLYSGSGLRERVRLFHIGIEAGDYVLVLFFDHAALQLQRIREFSGSVCKIPGDERKSFRLFVLCERRHQALDFLFD